MSPTKALLSAPKIHSASKFRGTIEVSGRLAIVSQMSLTPQQLKAAKLLASDWSQIDVAKKLGIASKTVSRWLKKPEFQDVLAKIQNRTTEKVVEDSSADIAGRIQGLLPKALDALEKFIDDPEARGSDKLRACHLIGSWAGLTQQKVSSSAPQQAEQLQVSAGLSEELVNQIRRQVLGVTQE